MSGAANHPLEFGDARLDVAPFIKRLALDPRILGDGHVRIALVENTQRLRQAVRNIRGFLVTGSNEAAPVMEVVSA